MIQVKTKSSYLNMGLFVLHGRSLGDENYANRQVPTIDSNTTNLFYYLCKKHAAVCRVYGLEPRVREVQLGARNKPQTVIRF